MRKKIFYLSDYLQGGKIQRHYKDIEKINDRTDLQEELIENRLKKLLDHATKTTRHYRDYEGMFDLQGYPVLKKKQLRDAGEKLLSSFYSGKKLYTRKTSGSYGTPMSICFTKEKMARHYAELIYFNKRAGLEIGERYINITTNRKTRIERFLKNVVTINPAVIDKNWYEQAIRIINRYNDSFIVGFPSVLHPIANILLNSRPYKNNIRMKGIVTIAEPLYNKVRKTIEDAFGCPVYNRYATMETGVIGHSIEYSNEISINRASYIVELLAFDGDRPVNEGEEGRVIVTDLFSYAMPLIRYETGDTATLISRKKSGVDCIKNPEGRIIETIFASNGEKISWAIIYDIMSAADHIIQYQFCQVEERSYQLYLITSPEYSKMEERELKSKFHDLLGADANLDFCYTDSIPALPSGKRPMIINSYRKD